MSSPTPSSHPAIPSPVFESSALDSPVLESTVPLDPALPELANDVRLVCQRIARRIRFEGTSMPPHQVSVLMKLLDVPRTPTWLAEAERVSTPSMTRTVNCLEQGALVKRTPHPTDGRQVLVELTAEGRTAMDGVLAQRESWMMSRLATLTGDEKQVLRDAAVLLQRVADL